MAYPSGQYYFDGADLFTVYGMVMEDRSFSDALLKFPDRKDSISHDWEDENGLDIDLSRTYLKEREATANITLYATDESDFWDKYHRFLNMLRQPGVRRVEIAELSSSYYMFYKGCSSFTRQTRLKAIPYGAKIVAQFSITMAEPNPQLDNNNVYLIDEEGRFLIT